MIQLTVMIRKTIIPFLFLLASSTLIPSDSSLLQLDGLSSSPQNEPRPTQENEGRKIQSVVFEATSQRHQIAIQALSKLLQIIHESRRKRNEAESDIEVYTHVFNDALELQKRTKGNIIKIEEEITQLKVQIQSQKQNHEKLKLAINVIYAERIPLERERSLYFDSLSDKEKEKALLLQELESLDSEFSSYVKTQNEMKTKCQDLKIEIQRYTSKFKQVEGDLQHIQEKKNKVLLRVKEKASIVEELKKQLTLAQKELSEEQIQLSNIEEDEEELPFQLRQYEKTLQILKSELSVCLKRVENIQKLIKELEGGKFEQLRAQINELQTQIFQERKKISDVDDSLGSSLQPLEDSKVKLDKALSKVLTLEGEIEDLQKKLEAAEEKGKKANELVASSKQKLSRANVAFKEQNRRISEAKMNLEKARAEEELAKKNLEQLFEYYFNNLPEEKDQN